MRNGYREDTKIESLYSPMFKSADVYYSLQTEISTPKLVLLGFYMLSSEYFLSFIT